MNTFSNVARIMSSISFAVFALVLMTTIRATQFKLTIHVLMLFAFVTSGVILFNSVLFKLPGWPAAFVASFMFLLSLAVTRIVRVRRAKEIADG